ncbi:hypothetical protein BpHYR1_048032 [Brachionus plicatilis]|uniref:Uncharacterized protein n=1 Tax=Brachionus plicatilis TaxID=10195 RepID=A0A3M7TA42_BRAPC|nr:hypothetical protein BpHYR1_048032 [Brachionus plicatilis]
MQTLSKKLNINYFSERKFFGYIKSLYFFYFVYEIAKNINGQYLINFYKVDKVLWIKVHWTIGSMVFRIL